VSVGWGTGQARARLYGPCSTFLLGFFEEQIKLR